MPNADRSPSGGISEVMLCWILWLVSNAFCEPVGLCIWIHLSVSVTQKSVFRSPGKLGLKNACNLIPAKPSVFEQPRDSNSETEVSGGTLMVYIKVMMFRNKYFSYGEKNYLWTICPKSVLLPTCRRCWCTSLKDQTIQTLFYSKSCCCVSVAEEQGPKWAAKKC